MRHLLCLLLGVLTSGMLACSSDSSRPTGRPTDRGRVVEAAPPAVPAASTTLAPATVPTASAPPSAPRPARIAKRPARRVRPAAPRSGMAALYQQCAVPTVRFAVLPARDTLLRCPQGTELTVPADAFVDAETGQPVSGPVVVQVREYYSLPDILLQNLTTTSGDRLLETGGMLHLEAQAAGRPCALRAGKNVSLRFPAVQPKPGMQLFMGVYDSAQRLDWQPVEASYDTWPTRGSWVRRRILPARFESYKNLRLIVEGTIPYFAADAARARALPRTRPESRRLRRAGTSLKQRLAELVEVAFDVTDSGRVTNVRPVYGADTALKRAAVRAVSLLPAWSPARCRTTSGIRAVRTSLVMPVYFTTSGHVIAQNPRPTDNQPWWWEETPLDEQVAALRLTQSRLRNARAGEVSAYVLQAAQLGWINCDRFLDSSQPKIDFVIDAGAPDADIKLVFANERAMLNASATRQQLVRFSNVPEGAPVTIVAIRYRDGLAQLATRRTTLGHEVERDLQFRSLTLDGLKAEIAKLEL